MLNEYIGEIDPRNGINLFFFFWTISYLNESTKQNRTTENTRKIVSRFLTRYESICKRFNKKKIIVHVSQANQNPI